MNPGAARDATPFFGYPYFSKTGAIEMRRPWLAGLEAVAHFATATPQAPALVCADGTAFSYADLSSMLDAVSERMQQADIGEDATVAVLAPQGLLQVLATFGVLRHCVCAPLQPRTTLSEVKVTLARMGATALIATPEFEAEATVAANMGLIVLRATDPLSPDTWSIQRSSIEGQARSVPKDTVLLLRTSATAGHPKIVPLSTRNLDAAIAARRHSLRLTCADRQLLMTSLCHIIGIENTLAQWLAGGSVIVTSGFDPSQYLHWLSVLQPTWYDCSPAVHQAALVQLERVLPEHSLRFLQSAGAPLPPDVRNRIEQLLHVPVFNDYGMTEARPIAVDAFLTGDHIAGSAGRACGLEIGIFDSDGILLPAGKEGEIVVRGQALFPGYMNDPEANRMAFDNGWFRTGDAGRLDEDGNLFIIGRLKEMINRGGEKIVPSEVDAAIAAHPAVLEAAAFAIPHPTLGEAVACAVVLREAHFAVTPIDLRRFAAERLASFKVPHRICFVDSIPRGELGKPQRWQLKEKLPVPQSAAAIEGNAQFQKLSPTSRDVFFKIREVWIRTLDRDDLSIDEDFFNAGGDSLAALNMLIDVDSFFQCNTSAQAAHFLDEPTLFRLTEMVGQPMILTEGPADSNEMRVFPVRDSRSGLRLFCAPAEQEEGLYFRGLARHLSGLMDLFIARRSRATAEPGLYTFEQDGADMARAIRTVQPEGPYLIAGFCYGGVIAAEAARCLSQAQHAVQLVLFDVPLPGYPGPAGSARIVFSGALAKMRGRHFRNVPSALAADGEPSPTATALPTMGGGFALVERLTRRLAWTAISHARAALRPLEGFPFMQSLFRQARKEYFPFYRARTLDTPILHFLVKDEPDRIQDVARYEWRRFARAGVTETIVDFDHHNLFHEANLPIITHTLLTWAARSA
jgi:acyl-CoA synthetase (AMP-forming)/AMP-acid ligase II/thioesterase domain-containing protein